MKRKFEHTKKHQGCVSTEERRQSSTSQEERLRRSHTCPHPDLGHLPLELWEMNFYCLSHPACGTLLWLSQKASPSISDAMISGTILASREETMIWHRGLVKAIPKNKQQQQQTKKKRKEKAKANQINKQNPKTPSCSHHTHYAAGLADRLLPRPGMYLTHASCFFFQGPSAQEWSWGRAASRGCFRLCRCLGLEDLWDVRRRRTGGEVRTAGAREGDEGREHSLRLETRFSE